MLSKTISLLALSAAVAVAKPYGYSHSHFHYSGLGSTSSSLAQSTGGESSINSTETVSPAATSATLTVAVTTAASSSAIAYTSAGTSAASSVSVASSAAASATSSSSSGSSSGGKKGLSYNTASLLSLFDGKASWAYNWGSSSGGSLPSGVEYVPMCWGADQAPGCASAVLATGASHMLSFNEPDHSGQAAMSVSDAVSKHIQYVATPLAGKVKIGSPAVTNGGTGMGLSYLESFLQGCGSGTTSDKCKLDFVAIHWYDSTSNIAYFKSHVTNAIALAAKYGISKVWITEFAGTGSDAAQKSFIEAALPWLEESAQSAVERYAYFMVGPESNGFGLVSSSTLNVAGTAYAAT